MFHCFLLLVRQIKGNISMIICFDLRISDFWRKSGVFAAKLFAFKDTKHMLISIFPEPENLYYTTLRSNKN
jgi:hypothetical protein